MEKGKERTCKKEKTGHGKRKRWDMEKGQGYRLGNADVTIMAQAPKMASHIDAMCAAIAQDLETDISNVNVKATTTERLGFTGRKEGIACEAVVLLINTPDSHLLPQTMN